LRHLSLGHNFISAVDAKAVNNLQQLSFLSLENNQLTCLGGISILTSLTELYLGNNNISNIREIFYLKNLSQLVILDLYGNPVVGATDNYRLFIIYHLKTLKALDGLSIVSLL
jgi:Leucine-rich repeat (LRR) protein